jgi:hypothetical protein
MGRGIREEDKYKRRAMKEAYRKWSYISGEIKEGFLGETAFGIGLSEHSEFRGVETVLRVLSA